MSPSPIAGAMLFDRARAAAQPRWNTIGELLRDSADRYGDWEFLRFPGKSLSFLEVEAYTGRLARVLMAHGVRPGDRVAIMMGNVPGWPLSWLAVIRAGAIAVPVNARYGEADLRHVLTDSGSVLALASEECAGLMRAVAADIGTLTEVCTLGGLAAELAGTRPDDPGVRVAPSHLANLQYTSGTTGFPKACMLSHDYWLRTAWLMALAAELHADDVVLTAQAFSYMDPQWNALMCLMGGVPLVVLPRFSASGFWSAVREHGATLTYVLGTMPLLMSKQPRHPLDRDNSMRLVLCSGIARERHRDFEERWGAPWREVYGSTESGLDLFVPPYAAETVGSGAMGLPPQGKEVLVVDGAGSQLPTGEAGEIVVRGKPMMDGYWNHPEATARAFRGGRFHTGDLGFRDEAGYIHHAGRLKDMIRRGGENISSAEVEAVLEGHSAVLAAAVVAIPDPLFEELPKAFVQLRPGRVPDAGTATSVLDHARRRLARFKVPAYLEFVDAFPMTPSARIQKRKLLEPARDQRAGSFDAARDAWA
ncbi:AMP-binding protein [Streptomyces sp. NPDC006627]|uniref:class I adenylate-forming enzyme family protein n=1 Tax=Streptomyces sp. NPDC006627 TaxID=3154679 RepID=UPI0033A4F8AE